jgi:excisionase family DNA binding protein
MGGKVSIDDAAAELGISKRIVRRLITAGDLVAYRVGSLPQITRIDVDDLDKLLNPVPVGNNSPPAKAAPKSQRGRAIR